MHPPLGLFSCGRSRVDDMRHSLHTRTIHHVEEEAVEIIGVILAVIASAVTGRSRSQVL
jgi:hypothetical protein